LYCRVKWLSENLVNPPHFFQSTVINLNLNSFSDFQRKFWWVSILQ
jgi:hypothetical protein